MGIGFRVQGFGHLSFRVAFKRVLEWMCKGSITITGVWDLSTWSVGFASRHSALGLVFESFGLTLPASTDSVSERSITQFRVLRFRVGLGFGV